MYANRLLAVGVSALLAMTAAATARAAEQTDSEKSESLCCFNNPGYSGTCQVQPAGDETCGSILSYLNNAMAQGKNYCGGTKIRQGWAEVECEEEKSVSTSSGRSVGELAKQETKRRDTVRK